MSQFNSRKIALMLLYEKTMTKTPIDTVISTSMQHKEIPKYTLDLLYGIDKHEDELNQKIKSISQNWDFNRILPINLSILKIGIFEKNILGVDEAIVVSQCIKLAEMFDGKDSIPFINAIISNA